MNTTRDTTKLLSFSDEELLVITRYSLSFYHKEENPFSLREGVNFRLKNVSRVFVYQNRFILVGFKNVPVIRIYDLEFRLLQSINLAPSSKGTGKIKLLLPNQIAAINKINRMKGILLKIEIQNEQFQVVTLLQVNSAIKDIIRPNRNNYFFLLTLRNLYVINCNNFNIRHTFNVGGYSLCQVRNQIVIRNLKTFTAFDIDDPGFRITVKLERFRIYKMICNHTNTQLLMILSKPAYIGLYSLRDYSIRLMIRIPYTITFFRNFISDNNNTFFLLTGENLFIYRLN